MKEPAATAAAGAPAGAQRAFRTAVTRFTLGLIVCGAVLFGVAGTFRYWQAGATLGALFVPLFVVLFTMARKAPDLLERRMRTREPEGAQKAIVLLATPFYLAVFVVPALDRRFGWSSVPAGIAVAAEALVLAGYLLTVRVLWENRFAARTVAVDAGQRVIATGPYSVVRHPMYSASILMFSAMPPALGSWWGLLGVVGIVAGLSVRAVNEESVLSRDLPGYDEYRRKVRFRIVPGIW